MSPYGNPPTLGAVASKALKAIDDPGVQCVIVVSSNDRTAVASGHVPNVGVATALLIDGLARLLHAAGGDVNVACQLIKERVTRLHAGIGATDSIGPWPLT